MTVREIRLFGDPVLSAKCATIDLASEAVKALVNDLIDTVRLPGRAGVAAPQIGIGLRAFSYNIDGDIGYILNPVLSETSGARVLVAEGCLSVPGLWHETPRYERARVEGFDIDGNRFALEGSGLMAQALQHECDHLEGMLYLDRLEKPEWRIAMKALRESEWFRNR